MEERFCQKVKQLGCTCVTISHRPALMAFHDIVLALDGEGGWSLHRGARGLSSEEGHSKEPAGGASSHHVWQYLSIVGSHLAPAISSSEEGHSDTLCDYALLRSLLVIYISYHASALLLGIRQICLLSRRVSGRQQHREGAGGGCVAVPGGAANPAAQPGGRSGRPHHRPSAPL